MSEKVDLKVLRAESVKVIQRRGPLEVKRKRRSFNSKKNKPPRDRCAVCDHQGWLEYHHRIQIKYGGDNSKSNLVVLCARCHDMVHNMPVIRSKDWLPTPSPETQVVNLG